MCKIRHSRDAKDQEADDEGEDKKQKKGEKSGRGTSAPSNIT